MWCKFHLVFQVTGPAGNQAWRWTGEAQLQLSTVRRRLSIGSVTFGFADIEKTTPSVPRWPPVPAGDRCGQLSGRHVRPVVSLTPCIRNYAVFLKRNGKSADRHRAAAASSGIISAQTGAWKGSNAERSRSTPKAGPSLIGPQIPVLTYCSRNPHCKPQNVNRLRQKNPGKGTEKRSFSGRVLESLKSRPLPRKQI